MSEEESFEESMAEAIRLGWVKMVGKDKLQLTEKGKKYVEEEWPRTINRSRFGKMDIGEFLTSAEEEGMEKELKAAVDAGLLRTYVGKDGARYWVDSDAPKQDNEP